MSLNDRGSSWGGYFYLPDSVEMLGIKPFHVTDCGSDVYYCRFYHDVLLDDATEETRFEFADVGPGYADNLADIHPEDLIPYSYQVWLSDKENGLSWEEFLLLRAFIAIPQYLGPCLDILPDEYQPYEEEIDIEGEKVTQTVYPVRRFHREVNPYEECAD